MATRETIRRREYDRRRRERYASDAAYREKSLSQNHAYLNSNRDEINARRRERLANDPEYRKVRQKQSNAWQDTNRQRLNARKRKKYASDSDYRKKCIQIAIETKRRRRNKIEKSDSKLDEPIAGSGGKGIKLTKGL